MLAITILLPKWSASFLFMCFSLYMSMSCSHISFILFTRSPIVICSSSLSSKYLVTLMNAYSLAVSIGLPMRRFFSSEVAWNVDGTCLPVRKLILHTWWYIASAACKSWANSILPRIACAQVSLRSVHTCINVAWTSDVLTGKTSLPLLLLEYLAGWPQSKQWSRNWNDDVCERRLRVGLQFGSAFAISLIALALVYVFRRSEWIVSPWLAHTLSPRSRLASLIPSLPFWRRTTVGLFWSSIIVFLQITQTIPCNVRIYIKYITRYVG